MRISDAPLSIVEARNAARSRMHPITVPNYLLTRNRHRLRPSLVIMGTSDYARGLICSFMELICERGDFDWGVSTISTKSSAVVDNLNRQERLFAAVEARPHAESAVLNGVICEALFAPRTPALAMSRLCSRQTRVVVLTISENGYHLRSDVTKSEADFENRLPQQWLDLADRDINHDVLCLDEPRTVLGYLVAALQWRKAHSMKPFTIVSCDDFPRSGYITKMVLLAFAEQVDRELARWINEEVDICDAMVDRIIPEHRLEASEQWLSELGVRSLTSVTCEPFKRWIVSDNWRGGVPDAWAAVGIEFMSKRTLDAWRQVKQRLLNGTHVNLAIVGALLGYSFVHEAIEDEDVRGLVIGFMRETERTLLLPPFFDAEQYINELLYRLSNRALLDPLHRVGRSRSAKIAEHNLGTAIRQLNNVERVGDHVRTLIALWIFSMLPRAEKEFAKFEDDSPASVAETCRTIWGAATAGNETLVASALQSRSVFPGSVNSDSRFTDELTFSLARLAHLVQARGTARGVRAFIRRRRSLCAS